MPSRSSTPDRNRGPHPVRDDHRLSAAQRARLNEWIPGATILADHSWGQIEAYVLEVEQDDERLVVKAGGPTNHHIGRELDAHDGWTAIWGREGITTRVRHSDRENRIFVAEWVPGHLIDRTPAAVDPRVHRRAGELLRVFHDQESRVGDERLVERVQRALASGHRIAAETVVRVEALLEGFDLGAVELVPTHGDWQPRNWLIDQGDVRVIDFGRFAFRSRASDLVRLDAQQWRLAPECETAFFEGYGRDPRSGADDHWRALRIVEAVGTAAWAHQVGDEDFEAQGHRMIATLLGED
ncbi:phosphotransferase [Microbacterium sp. GXF0217]